MVVTWAELWRGRDFNVSFHVLTGRSCHDVYGCDEVGIVKSHFASGGCVLTRPGLSQGCGCDEDGIVTSRFGL